MTDKHEGAGKPHPLVLAIVAKRKPGVDDDKREVDRKGARADVAKDVIGAVKAGDEAALAEALEAFVNLIIPER